MRLTKNHAYELRSTYVINTWQKYSTYTKNAYSKQLKFEKYRQYIIHTHTNEEKYPTQRIEIEK